VSEVSMESIHIKFDFSDALDCKKMLLSSELTFLNLLHRMDNFRILREKELSIQTAFRASLNYVNREIGVISRELPKTKEFKVEEVAKVKLPTEKRGKKRLEEDLREVKRQLERLNSL
jgi:hypothetical protein